MNVSEDYLSTLFIKKKPCLQLLFLQGNNSPGSFTPLNYNIGRPYTQGKRVDSGKTSNNQRLRRRVRPFGEKHKIPLETMHMVDHNDVIRPCFRGGGGGQIAVDEYIVQKSRFRLHYERVLCRTQ